MTFDSPSTYSDDGINCLEGKYSRFMLNIEVSCGEWCAKHSKNGVKSCRSINIVSAFY